MPHGEACAPTRGSTRPRAAAGGRRRRGASSSGGTRTSVKTIKDALNHKKRQAARRCARDRGPRAAALHECPEGDPVALAQGLAHEFFLAESAVSGQVGQGPLRAAPGRDRAARRRGGAHRRPVDNEGTRAKSCSAASRLRATERLSILVEAVAGVTTEDHLDEGAEARGRQAARGPVLLSAAAGARQGPVSHPQEEVRARRSAYMASVVRRPTSRGAGSCPSFRRGAAQPVAMFESGVRASRSPTRCQTDRPWPPTRPTPGTIG